LKPISHSYVAILEDSPNLDGKRLPAVRTLVNADPVAFALDLPCLINAPAMRANRTVGPKLGFNKLVGFLFVVEAVIG
jgi:hypothetical protein